jgi:hypothetical protein
VSWFKDDEPPFTNNTGTVFAGLLNFLGIIWNPATGSLAVPGMITTTNPASAGDAGQTVIGNSTSNPQFALYSTDPTSGVRNWALRANETGYGNIDLFVSPTIGTKPTVDVMEWAANGNCYYLAQKCPSSQTGLVQIDQNGMMTAVLYSANGPTVPIVTRAASPPASPRFGDIWIDNTTSTDVSHEYLNVVGTPTWVVK